jgi:GT2 family glycosyltransferase
MNNDVIASIIIVCFNGRPYLENCLNSVLDQEMPRNHYEVLVVDNNSTDGSTDQVEINFPSVRVIKLTKNIGFYPAFNQTATTIAQGIYLIALPQDTIVHKKWLSELVKTADRDQNVKVCAVNTVQSTSPDYERKDRVAGVTYLHIMRMTKFGYVTSERKIFSEKPIEVLTAVGTSALIKRDMLELTDCFFDPSMGHYAGDVEIGLRVNVLGGKVMLVPTAILFHIEDNKSWMDTRYLLRALEGARDNILAFYKNMYGLEFALFLPWLILGTPLKAFALRTSLLRRVLLFLIAFALSPLAFFLALLRFPTIAIERRRLLEKRKTDRLWLLKTILKEERV